MTPGALFNVLIKMAGIFFLKDTILAFTSFIPMLTGAFGDDGALMVAAFIGFLLVIGIYVFIIYMLIFRTGWIIDKLKLTEDLGETAFSFNIHRSTILSISFIVAGILTLVNVLPFLIKEIAEYFRLRQQGNNILNMSGPFDPGYLFIYIGEVVIAVLLIAYQRHLVNFIESRRKQ